jgi:hypothetical protein
MLQEHPTCKLHDRRIEAAGARNLGPTKLAIDPYLQDRVVDRSSKLNFA